MKNLIQKIILVILVCQTTILVAQTKKVETYYDIFTKTNVKESYTALSTPPYKKHGIYKLFDQNGHLLEVSNYSNGQLHGLSKTYQDYSQGKDIKSECNYSNGQLNGNCKSYAYNQDENGKLVLLHDVNYINGKEVSAKRYHWNGKIALERNLNGIFREWYESGNKKFETTLKNGKTNGAFKEWYESGKLKYDGVFEDDYCIGGTDYFENGKIKQKQILDLQKKEIKRITCYDTNEVVISEYFPIDIQINKYKEISYKEGKKVADREVIRNEETEVHLKDGNETVYFENGEKKLECTYVKGQPQGLFTEYYPNGKVKETGKFFEGRKFDMWKKFYENGMLEAESKYKLATSMFEIDLVEQTFFNADGQKTKQVQLKSKTMEPTGNYTEWYPNGKKKVFKLTDPKCCTQFEMFDENGAKIKYYSKDMYNNYFGDFYDTIIIELLSTKETVIGKGTFYDNGKKTNKWTYYFLDKKVRAEGEYEKNEKIGTWYYYNKEGKLAQKELYGDGRLIQRWNAYDLLLEENQADLIKFETIYGVASNYVKGKHIYEKSQLLIGKTEKERLNPEELQIVLKKLLSLETKDTADLNKSIKKAKTKEEVKSLLLSIN